MGRLDDSSQIQVGDETISWKSEQLVWLGIPSKPPKKGWNFQMPEVF